MAIITEEEVKAGYLKEQGHEISEQDLKAFYQLGELLNISMEGTYEEIVARMDAKMMAELSSFDPS